VVRYRTEVFIPPDRLIGLQLPDHFPEGRAVVTVHYLDVNETIDDKSARDEELEGPDMEWWEEFEDGAGRLG
jgi:hypothetical protein